MNASEKYIKENPYMSSLQKLKVATGIKQAEYEFSGKREETRLEKIYKASLFPFVVLFIILAILFASFPVQAASRIKDIVYFEGIRENVLVGYGLVVGLNGTGDNLKNSPFTEKGLSQFLTKLGINTKGTNLKTKNVAAVTVTATLPPFSRSGSKIDVSVGTMGDAKSLEGGMLLATPLLGADGNVYAVAQGPVAIGGLITNSSSSNSTNKGVQTSGYVSNGAIVEEEIKFDLSKMKKIRLALRNPDISTSRRISESINDVVGEDAATSIDPGTVEVIVPEIYGDNVIGLLADIEQMLVQPDQSAKVVIDESSGTVVIGEDVKIDTVAIAQGNLLVTVGSTQNNRADRSAFASDSAAASFGEEEVVQQSVNRLPGNGLALVRQGANLRDLVTGLNALGVGTRDLITILQSIKVAGALHANIEVR